MSSDWSEWSTESLMEQLYKQINSDTPSGGDAGTIPGEVNDIEQLINVIKEELGEEAGEVGDLARDLKRGDWDEGDLKELVDAEEKLDKTKHRVERVREEAGALENALEKTEAIMDEIRQRAS